MQAFEISAARHINRALSEARRVRRRGRVFSDRYHARVLRSPRQVRHALAYVLNNWRRHEEDHGPESMFWTIDPYSSAIHFSGWRELDGRRSSVPERHEPLPVGAAESWLLRVGWRRHGLISVREVPGPRIQKLVA